jgi:acetyl esterase
MWGNEERIVANQNSTGSDPLHPQMRAALIKNNALQPTGIERDSLPIREIREIFAETREFWNKPERPLHGIENFVIPGPMRDIQARCYRPVPHPDLPLIVYFHGGGWVLGSNDTHDSIIRQIAYSTNCLVIGVDYSLAPENPFPAAFDDVGVALSYILDNPDHFGFDLDTVLVGGDSSGANIAITGAVAFEQQCPGLIKGALSYYGVLDSSLDSASIQEFGNGTFGLSSERLAFYWNHYVPDTADRADPRVDPCCLNLERMFPCHIVAAACDVVRDGSVRFADRLTNFGVPCMLDIRKGMGHAFMGYGRMVEDVQVTASRSNKFILNL